MTYHTLLNEGRERVYKAGNSEQSALLLLNELCAKKGVNLYAEMESEVDEEIQTDYLEGIHRLEKLEPLGYILGYEPFYGYDFFVSKDVLIPRPETEELVALVLQKFDEHFPEEKTAEVFDVATGSGAIGISLDLEEPRMHVRASDISKEALEMAKKNNEHLGAHVEFFEGSMLDPFIEANLHCDILVCNPPYIKQDEVMEESVINYEPHVALFGGKDGLRFYREVFEKADKVMNPKGFMAFEMGYDQRESLSALAREYFSDAHIEVLKDMNGKDRMLLIELGKEA